MIDTTRHSTARRPSRSDRQAIDWLLCFTEIASEFEGRTTVPPELLDRFLRWATRTPANLRSFLETMLLYQALGGCADQVIRRQERVRRTGLFVAAAVLGAIVVGVLLWYWATR